MVAIGMGLVWFGYAVFMVGYCWVRGYNVTFAQVFTSSWSGTGTAKAA